MYIGGPGIFGGEKLSSETTRTLASLFFLFRHFHGAV